MRSSYNTVETKRHICDIQEHKCPLKFHLSTGMSLSSAGTFNKSLGNGSTFSNWSLLFGMNLTKHIDQSRHTLLLFFQTGLATLTEIFRITYWDQCVLKTCLPTKGCSKIMFRKQISILFFYSRKPRDKSKVQAGLTCSASHASLKCHASFKTLALSLVKVGLKPR